MGEQQQQWPAPVFGTMERRDDDPEAMYTATREALRAGYRHFDLAEHYQTQEQVGRALSEFMAEQQQEEDEEEEEEAGGPRSALFITNKVDGMPLGPYPAVKARVQRMLSRCQLAHFDLLLIHYPTPAETTDLDGDPSALCTPERWEHFQQHCAEAWRNMSSLRQDGLCTHVGLSNCYPQHLQCFAQHAAEPSSAPIYANEIFIDAAHPETDFVASMQAAGIRVFAYRPLAFLPNLKMLEVMGVSEVAAAIDAAAVTATTRQQGGSHGGGGGGGGGSGGTTHGDARGSWQQLILAWLLARGISPVASSTSPEHIAANLNAGGLPVCGSASGGGAEETTALLQTALHKVHEHLEMVEMVGGERTVALQLVSF
jgi:alcohol dehydrogenase (NADP+)